MLAGSAGLLAGFLYVEARVPEPIVPLSLFSNAIFRAATINGLLAGMALFGSISFIPLYLQGVMGASATRAGSVLTPILLGWVTFAVIGGRLLLKIGYRSTVIAGMVLLAVGFFFLTRITPSASATYITLDMLATGAGMGLSMLTMLIAVQSAVPREQLGIATSSTQFFRSIGGIVGVAIMGSVLSSRLSSEVERIVRADGSHQGLAELAQHPDIIINAEARARIPPSILQDFTTALDQALHSVFLVGLAVAILALCSAFLVPRGKSQEHVKY
jgi:predicted MFS family arabinose efflux permease